MNAKRYFTLLLLMTITVCASWAQTVTDSVKIKIETSAGAEIGIDGEVSSTNIMSIKVPVGKHKVNVNYGESFHKEYEINVEIGGQTTFTFPILGKLNITAEPAGSKIYLNGSYRGVAPITLELIGKNTITAKNDPKVWYDEEKTVEIGFMSESSLDFTLKKIPPREYVKSNHFYIEGDYQLLSFPSYGAAIGGYINNVNLELGIMMGSNECSTYWYNQTGIKAADIDYKASRMHVKAGYGFRVNPRFQVTPQIGGSILSVSGSGDSYYDGYHTDITEYTSDTYAVQLLASLRMTYALCTAIQLVVTPEYTCTLKEGPLFEKISTASDDIKGWGSGLNIKAGLSIYF